MTRYHSAFKGVRGSIDLLAVYGRVAIGMLWILDDGQVSIIEPCLRDINRAEYSWDDERVR